MPVPDDEEGELWVRGYGLMHGYYKKERSEVFDDDGWLHTGDRVFLHGGRPYFVGRYTEMVKSRGANVAPREVELFLEEHFDEVLYAFVLGMPHPELGEEVTAVLVAAQGCVIDPARRQDSCPHADLGVQGPQPRRGLGRSRRAVVGFGEARQAGHPPSARAMSSRRRAGLNARQHPMEERK